MATLEQRVQRLEDEQAILQTLYAYGHGLDYVLEDAWIDCWTPDAVLDWPGRALMRGHKRDAVVGGVPNSTAGVGDVKLYWILRVHGQIHYAAAHYRGANRLHRYVLQKRCLAKLGTLVSPGNAVGGGSSDQANGCVGGSFSGFFLSKCAGCQRQGSKKK